MTNFQRALVLEYLKQNSRKAALEILYDCAKTISQEQSSPLKATMGYNGESEELILHFADQNITLSKEHHGNTALYRATSGNQALNIDELIRLCCLLHEVSRRSGSESRESQERADTERNQSQEERNRVETGETETLELLLERAPEAERGEILAEIHSHVSPSDPYKEETLRSRLLQSLRKRGYLEQSNDTESTNDNDEDDGEGEKSGTGNRSRR